MIIYRKLKQPTKELSIIDDAIKAFLAHNKTSPTGKNTKVIQLSKQLNILVGLTDKKGNALHDPEPIATWKKRKALLQQRMKKARKR